MAGQDLPLERRLRAQGEQDGPQQGGHAGGPGGEAAGSGGAERADPGRPPEPEGEDRAQASGQVIRQTFRNLADLH